MEGDAVVKFGSAGGRKLELLVDLGDFHFVRHRGQVANDLLEFGGWHTDDRLEVEQVGHFVRVGVQVEEGQLGVRDLLGITILVDNVKWVDDRFHPHGDGFRVGDHLDDLAEFAHVDPEKDGAIALVLLERVEIALDEYGSRVVDAIDANTGFGALQVGIL